MAKPKIFVSHSTLDTAFATLLVSDLLAAGADAWIDSEDLGAGNFQQRISEALAASEWFSVGADAQCPGLHLGAYGGKCSDWDE